MPIAALIVGICSLVAALVGGAVPGGSFVAAIILLVIAIIGGIVGIVLGAKTMKQFPEKKGFGVGGLVTSIIALVYAVISLIACVACVACAGAVVNEAGKAVEQSYNEMTPEEKAQLEQQINQAAQELESATNQTQAQ